MTRGRSLAAIVVALVTTTTASLALPSLAQTPSTTPGATETRPDTSPKNVSVQPNTTADDDPHNGTWFVVAVTPGDPQIIDASIINPEDAVADVELYVRDLDTEGEATIVDDPAGQAGVGSWVEIVAEGDEVVWNDDDKSARFEVAGERSRVVSLEVTVPAGTAAGDYVGVVVAETRFSTPDLNVRQRHATRIYVTVPGIADTSFEIVDVRTTLNSQWWPTEATVTVTLGNTGVIRVAPIVTVGGVRAPGARLLLRDTEETYIARVPVSPLDGRLDLPVDAADEASQEIRATLVRDSVVPWRILALGAVLAVLAVPLARRRQRRSRLGQLETDFQRLERLVTTVRQEIGLEGAAIGTAAALSYDADADPDHALHVALKRARRTQSHDSLARVALAMHTMNVGDPLAVLVEAMQYDTEHQAELVAAAATYDQARLAQLAAKTQLPPDVTAFLLERPDGDRPALTAGETVILPAHRAGTPARALTAVGTDVPTTQQRNGSKKKGTAKRVVTTSMQGASTTPTKPSAPKGTAAPTKATATPRKVTATPTKATATAKKKATAAKAPTAKAGATKAGATKAAASKAPATAKAATASKRTAPAKGEKAPGTKSEVAAKKATRQTRSATAAKGGSRKAP